MRGVLHAEHRESPGPAVLFDRHDGQIITRECAGPVVSLERAVALEALGTEHV